MSIQLEFIDFIVPRGVIEQKYPGGWVQCLKDHERLIGGRVWYDEHLFRDGAMNPMDIEGLVNEWQRLGINTHKENEDGMPIEWLDVCVCESLLGGPTLKCDWIDVDVDKQIARLKGYDQVKLITRRDFSITKQA